MANKQRGASKQAQATAYKSSNRWKTNRERKLKRALREQPNNEQIALALKDIRWRRTTPGKAGAWSKTNKRIAKLFKEFTGRASHDLFSSNPKVQAAALMAHGPRQFLPMLDHLGREKKVSFALGARIGAGA